MSVDNIIEEFGHISIAQPLKNIYGGSKWNRTASVLFLALLSNAWTSDQDYSNQFELNKKLALHVRDLYENKSEATSSLRAHALVYPSPARILSMVNEVSSYKDGFLWIEVLRELSDSR